MKKDFNIVKLYFTEPLALMSEKKDEFQNEVLVYPSDTLKGALVSGLALTGNENEIARLNENLKVSSAYPFVNDKYFFPKPMIKLPFVETGKPGENKVFKKIQFIEKSLFEKVLNSVDIRLTNNNFIHSGKFIVENKENYPDKIYESQTEERVSIGNTNVFAEAEKGSPFYVSRTYFEHTENYKAGLYFVYEADEESNSLLKRALEVLQDEGIGADRRIGNGRFIFEFTKIDLNIPEKANKQMLLSKYIPTKEEIENGLLDKASYNLSKRGGYLAGTSREQFAHYSKRDIYLIDEASVFDVSANIQGKIVDLLDEANRNEIKHPVWREGRPVVIQLLSDENYENNG